MNQKRKPKSDQEVRNKLMKKKENEKLVV